MKIDNTLDAILIIVRLVKSIGHFRVAVNPIMKARLSAKLFMKN